MNDAPGSKRINDPLKAEVMAHGGKYFRDKEAAARKKGDSSLEHFSHVAEGETDEKYQARYGEGSEEDAAAYFRKMEGDVKNMRDDELRIMSELMRREISRREEEKKSQEAGN